MVPVTGLEPVRCRQRWILSPLRLPIPSHRPVTRSLYRRRGANSRGKFPPPENSGKQRGKYRLWHPSYRGILYYSKRCSENHGGGRGIHGTARRTPAAGEGPVSPTGGRRPGGPRAAGAGAVLRHPTSGYQRDGPPPAEALSLPAGRIAGHTGGTGEGGGRGSERRPAAVPDRGHQPARPRHQPAGEDIELTGSHRRLLHGAADRAETGAFVSGVSGRQGQAPDLPLHRQGHRFRLAGPRAAGGGERPVRRSQHHYSGAQPPQRRGPALRRGCAGDPPHPGGAGSAGHPSGRSHHCGRR